MRTTPVLAVILLVPACLGDIWSPIDPEELKLTAPRVEKDAPAEVLLSETKLENQLNGGYGGTVVSHYLRIKIFTDKGRDAAKVELNYFRRLTISNIAGRTIKSDGVIRELKSDGIFDKDVVKTSGLKVRAKTFVLPDVAAGDIIEYRYRENWDAIYNYMRLPMQRTIPVRKGIIRVRPLPPEYFSASMRANVFHGENTPFTADPQGFSVTTFENLPAYREEPYMPPEDEIRTWMLIFYSEKSKLVADKFWIEHGRKIYAATKPLMRVSDDIKRESARIVGEASTPDEKLGKLYEFCQSKIKNTGLSAGEVAADDRKEMKVNKTPSDTLRQGMGTGHDINMLFAALVTAAGFDARPADTSDRSDCFLNPNFPDAYFLSSQNVAVRVGDKWRFFDAANRYLPMGMLRWQEESANALVADPKEPEWVPVQASPAAASKSARTGRFTLSEDGTLEGDVKIVYTGHEMIERKRLHALDSMEKRQKQIEESLTARLPGADVTGVEIKNAEGVKPLVYSYHVKVPGYAQRTGKRLFLPPAFFQRNMLQRFSSSDRKYAVYFDYCWSEEDDIEIDFPPGYLPDHPDAPPPIRAGDAFVYTVKMQIRDQKTLIYRRTLSVDGILFPVRLYPTVKKLFDAQFKEDEHLMTLKQDAPASGLQP